MNDNYIEVTSNITCSNEWREIVLDTGSAQSTLQDFKLSEFASGYTYNSSNAFGTESGNRFIYWKGSNDILELIELSMDANLSGNHLRVRFQNTPVLDGISIHETPDQVYVLIATVGSVHRLSFPHPKKITTGSATHILRTSPRSLLTSTSLSGFEHTLPSIFSSVYSESLHDSSISAALNESGSSSIGMHVPITSCSWLTASREGVFVIATSSGSLIVAKLTTPTDASSQEHGKVIIWELRQTTIMGKLWNTFVPTIIRGSREGDDAAVSLISHAFHDDCLIFALCRDLRIRLWSYKRQECLMVHYILQQSAGVTGTTAGGTPKGHQMIVRRPVILRKWSNGDGHDASKLYLAAFVIGSEQRQFYIFEFDVYTPNELRRIAIINAPEADLVDFALCYDQIWSLWLSSDNSFTVLHCPIESFSSWDWKRIASHSQLTQNVNINSLLVDTREHHIADIFWCGKFSRQTIAKAISILNRIPVSSYAGCSMEMLIEEAIKIVETTIRGQYGALELTADDYTAIQMDVWGKLYSYCVQYHNIGNKPLGLFIDQRTGLLGIIKRSNISYLRKSDVSDAAIINSKFANYGPETKFPIIDPSLTESIRILLKCVNIISKSLTDDDQMTFEAKLLRGDKLEHIATDLVNDSLLSAIDPFSPNNDPLKQAFDNVFTHAPFIVEAIEAVLKGLDFGHKNKNSFTTNPMPILTYLFSSDCGVTIVSESVKQLSRLRFNFCRDLLLFQRFILHLRQKGKLGLHNIERLQSVEIPQTALLLQMYYLMTWICETQMIVNNSSSVEDAARMALLELNESMVINRKTVPTSSFNDNTGPRSILSHYLQHYGGVLAKKQLTFQLTETEYNEELVTNKKVWASLMPLYVSSVEHLIWPLTNQLQLAQFFLGIGQYRLLQQYIQLLDLWCDINVSSRQFLNAFCYLILGEPSKAVILFNKAFLGINEEPFLRKIFNILPDYESTTNEELLDNEENDLLSPNLVYKYFTKLIQLFKLYSHYESIIDLVTIALSFIDPSDDQYEEHVSSLYSTQFTCHLELGNTNKAYESMIFNPDMFIRKISLRQFVVYHCESGKMSDLISFSYNDVEEEFVNIIESRARATELKSLMNDNNYYYFLYAYFVKDNNYRRAASVIFEYGQKLSHESNDSIECIAKEADCYLVALNCLKIVNPTYSWIVLPIAKQLTDDENGSSPTLKRNHESTVVDGDDEQSYFRIKRDIKILDSNDIKKKYELTRARLRLLQKDEKKYAIAFRSMSPDEIIALLISASMFDTAFHIGSMLKVKSSFERVFEGIVAKYIYVIQSGAGFEVTDIYDCFVENDTASLSYINTANISPSSKVWHLIMKYLEMFESKGETRMYRCVSEKLLASGLPIPTELRLKYQKLNCPELLRLLLTYDYIEDAYYLAIEYLNAFMGHGTEYFDIVNPILPNASPVYFPRHIFNSLINILEEDEEVHDNYKIWRNTINSELNKLNLLLNQTS